MTSEEQRLEKAIFARRYPGQKAEQENAFAEMIESRKWRVRLRNFFKSQWNGEAVTEGRHAV